MNNTYGIGYKRYYLRIVSYILKLKRQFGYSYVKGFPHVQYHLLLWSSDPQRFLYASIGEGKIEMVKEAIKRGAIFNGYDNHGLKLASKYGYTEIVKYLEKLDSGGTAT